MRVHETVVCERFKGMRPDLIDFVSTSPGVVHRQHSVRVSDQYRVCFTWTDQGPVGVEIVDYHQAEAGSFHGSHSNPPPTDASWRDAVGGVPESDGPDPARAGGNQSAGEGERRQVDFSIDTRGRWMEEEIEVKLRNHKAEPVDIIVKENLYRWSKWQIKTSTQPYEKVDARTIHFPVTVAKDGEAVVRYRVRYTW